jgi:hypothetical protein
MSTKIGKEVKELHGRIIEIPIEVLTTPRSGESVADSYWAVREGRAIFYQRYGSRGWSLQCNSNEVVANKVIAKLYPGAEVVFIPVAFLGPRDEDWGHTLTPALLEAAHVPE